MKKRVLLSLRPTDKKGIFKAYIAGKNEKADDMDLYEVSDIVEDIKSDKAQVLDQADIDRIADDIIADKRDAIDPEAESSQMAEDIKADKQANAFSEAEAEVLGAYINSCEKDDAETIEEANEIADKLNVSDPPAVEDDEPHDKNVKLMSPTMMVVRRFFRSKLSIIGLIMVIGLFLFSFVGPLFYTQWGMSEPDSSPVTEYAESTFTFVVNGQTYEVRQATESQSFYNTLAPASPSHPLGTDIEGYDVLARLMYGGRVSLIVSFLAVFLITILGVIIGGIAGYFGGWVDNVIMRLCDILMCLPGIPILLIVGFILDSQGFAESESRIYLLMTILSLISWPGTARLVRGQILSLREQEYMVAAEAMGYSAGRKIFKHLIPNVMPQLIVQMSLSLGSMILYEATLSYLNLGVRPPNSAWGTMINIISSNTDVLKHYPLVWVPAGICIVIAVLGFNFVGDGLRDALDPKARR